MECHIGSGVEWFFKAKINGAHQLIAYAMDNYNRPIATPVKNLRPARDICEQCHWPEKFLGNLNITFEHFMSDKKNTPYAVRMLMKVNSGRPGAPMGGIHYGMWTEENKVEYYAIDDKRQDIVWMRVTNTKDGSEKIFRNKEFEGRPPVALVRSMDCVDCHNRPAHVFPTANDSVEQSMALGRINTTLPNIKRYAVQAMLQKEITTSAEAPTKITDSCAIATRTPPDCRRPSPRSSVSTPNRYFPSARPIRRVYPNNIGHKDWPGCFRCHDDKHKTASGETVRASDCSSCHVILAQGKTEELATLTSSGLEFKHPGGSYDEELRCADCHNGGIQASPPDTQPEAHHLRQSG